MKGNAPYSFLVFLLCTGTALVLTLGIGCQCGDDDDDAGASDADNDVDDDLNDDADDDVDDDLNDDADDDADDDDVGSDVVAYEDGDDLVLGNNLTSLRVHRSLGRYSVLDGDGVVVVDHAESMAQSHVLAPKFKWRTTEMELAAWEAGDYTGVLGEGMTLTLSYTSETAPLFEITFAMMDGQSALLADMRLTNTGDSNINVGGISPLVAVSPGGKLAFGNNRDLRILTGGILNYGEITAPIAPGNLPVVSNGNMLVYNQENGSSLNVGHLTYDLAQPIVITVPQSGSGSAQTLHVISEVDPVKVIPPDGEISAETMILDFGQSTPFDALELYADGIKAWNNIETWLERHPEIGVPVGWNSWSGSSSGGYGTDINEQIIVDNMDFADRELRRWGMNYFQIDDGWATVGDWEVWEDRFPDHGDQNGIEWLFARANSLGFQTGIWMEAFNARQNADVYINHPEWFSDPIIFGLVGSDPPSLDLSHPEVQDRLVGLMETLLDWGVQWFKLDFAYLAPLTQGWHDPSLTRVEFYRNAVGLLRETLGEDVFFVNVELMWWTIGLIDGRRLTLDTMPSWKGEEPDDLFMNQGLKPGYMVSIRKYWLHNRLCINHPDLIFFREHAQPEYEPLTLNESITFATSVALQGGIVKIGDKIVDLAPDHVDALRRILPVYGPAGRPLDLLKRRYPEVISLPVPDFSQAYHVIGLSNWGANMDLTQLPYAEVADADRMISTDLQKAGLDPSAQYHAYEFWTQNYLGTVSQSLEMEVPARTARVVALRPVLDRPQFLGTNRHVLGGVKVIDSIQWNAESNTLTGVQEASVGTGHAPFEFHLAFFIPDGFTFDEVEFDLPEGIEVNDRETEITPADGGNVLDLTFTVIETTPPGQGASFEKLTWVLSFSS